MVSISVVKKLKEKDIFGIIKNKIVTKAGKVMKRGRFTMDGRHYKREYE